MTCGCLTFSCFPVLDNLNKMASSYSITELSLTKASTSTQVGRAEGEAWELASVCAAVASRSGFLGWLSFFLVSVQAFVCIVTCCLWQRERGWPVVHLLSAPGAVSVLFL